MKRSSMVLGLLAVCSLAAAEFTPEAWEKMCEAARRRPRPIMVYNDGDDLIEPLKQNGEAMLDEYLARRAAGITAPPASTLFFTTIYHQQASDLSYVPALLKMREAGYDDIQVQLDHARKHGVEFFADYRFNDVHDEKERPDKPNPLFPVFKREHPEVLFATWDKPTQYGLWSSLDFDSKLVRDHVARQLRELAEKYDIDGLNIDFGREPSLFRTVGKGGVASPKQLALMTKWIGEVHAMLTEAGQKRGRPILLSVRVPDSVGYCRAIGIDLEQWLEKGYIDMLITGVNFRFNPWEYSSALAKKYNRPFFASIDYPELHPARPNSMLFRRTRPGYAGRAAAALTAGADGLYYFNVMPAGAMRGYLTPMAELANADKMFHITDRYIYKPERHLKNGSRFVKAPLFHPWEPFSWSDVKPKSFILEYADAKYSTPGELVCGLVEGLVKPADGLAISSNGKAWSYVGRKGDCLVYSIPEGALTGGANKITFQLKSGAEAFLSDFAVKVETSPDGKKLAEMVDPEKEQISTISYRADSGKLPGPEWKSTYLAGNIKLINDPEPLLHLDNAEKPNRWQSFVLTDQNTIAMLGGHVLIRFRARMTRAPQPPAYGFLCIGGMIVYKSKVYRADFQLLADNRIINFNESQRFKLADVTKLHDYEIEVNAARGSAVVRQDGKTVGTFKLAPIAGTTPGLLFGDGSGRIEGAVDLAYVEFKRLK